MINILEKVNISLRGREPMSEERNLLSRLFENPVILGILGAIVIGLIGTILLSVIFYFTSLSESYLQLAGTTLYLIGAFAGGFMAAKKAGNRGIMYGAEVGLIYFLIFLFIMLISSPASLSALTVVLRGIYTLIVAAAGGIVGIAFVE